MGFDKGDKVVCIDDSGNTLATMRKFSSWPVRDEIYTVREQRPEGAEGGVLLEEIKNEPVYFQQVMGKLEPAYHPDRFRRVEEAGQLEEQETESHEQ